MAKARRARTIVATLVLWVTAVSTADAGPRRLLTMRGAERAIDLAWQAELADDAAGARAALEGLTATSTRSEEAAARAQLTTWLDGLRAREAAFTAHGRTARGYHEAFATLKDWGARADPLWARATRDLAPGALVLPALHLDVGGVRGAVDRRAVTKLLTAELTERGLALAPAAERFSLVVDVDASDAEVSAREARVTATVALVVRDAAAKAGAVTGSVSKRRSEERRTESEAARMAVRRASEDAVDGVLFLLRARALGDAAGRAL
ncbi:hypothetical protein L6R52_29985 [Myxococcota bacterium]|nr:hypothetical protein [Myxococcota bacterium]